MVLADGTETAPTLSPASGDYAQPAPGGSEPALRVTFAEGRQRTVADALGRIAIGGGFLTLLTLSFYRFWMKTRQRQLIWRETRIGDDAFEYTGTALELLIGSMIAIVILAIWLGAANLLLAYLQLSAWQDFETTLLLSPILAAPLIAFAIYRARRYRMLRTRFRGIRCGMDGSGLAFAGRWMLWTAVQLVTLGLATPFKALALERYMTDHMLYGDQRFRFQPRPGAGRRLFIHFLLPWVAGAVLVGIVAAPFLMGNEAATNFWEGFKQATEIQAEQQDRNSTGLLMQNMIGLGFVLALLIYPFFLRYESREIAELMSARRLGDAWFDCRLTWGATGRPVFAWFWRYWLMLFPIMLLAMVPLAAGGFIAFLFEGVAPATIFERMLEGGGDLFAGFTSTPSVVAMLVGVYLAYGVFIIFMMWLGSVVYFRRLHTFVCRGTTLHGASSLDSIRQRDRDEQLESEGFADALDIGGI